MRSSSEKISNSSIVAQGIIARIQASVADLSREKAWLSWIAERIGNHGAIHISCGTSIMSITSDSLLKTPDPLLPAGA